MNIKNQLDSILCKKYDTPRILHGLCTVKTDRIHAAVVSTCQHTLLMIVLTCICLWSRLFRMTLGVAPYHTWRHTGVIVRYWYVRVTYAHVAGWVGGIRKIKAIRWGAYYYSLDIDAIKKRKNAECNKQYRLKLKSLMQRQASTSTRIVVMRIGYIF
jgi:hypothetical protein